MGLTITETVITSDQTAHTAKLWPFEGEPTWSVTWLPGRILDHGQAVTAMTIAETVAEHAGNLAEPAGWQMKVSSLAAELGISGPIAIAEAAKPRGGSEALPGHNRHGDPCPSWCIEDHNELIIPEQPELGYMCIHKSRPAVPSMFGYTEVYALKHTGAAPMICLQLHTVGSLNLSLSDARTLALMIPMFLPHVSDTVAPLSETILTVIATASGIPDE